MKPKLEQEIWHLHEFAGAMYLQKMKVGYIGKSRFLCHEQVDPTNNTPIWFISYGCSWFLTEEEALAWLERNDYKWNEYARGYTKKGK